MDDSTAVIQCDCPITSSKPFLPPKPRPQTYEEEGRSGVKAKGKKKDDAEPVEPNMVVFAVGDLVQVAGRVVNAPVFIGGRKVIVDKIGAVCSSFRAKPFLTLL